MAAEQADGTLDLELGLGAVAQRRPGPRPGVIAGDEVGPVAAAGEGGPDVTHDVGLDPVGAQLAPLRHGDALDQVDLDRVLGEVGGAHGGEVGLPGVRVLLGQEAELGRAQAVLEGVVRERALPTSVKGPRERAPLARAVSARVGLRRRGEGVAGSGVGCIGPASGEEVPDL